MKTDIAPFAPGCLHLDDPPVTRRSQARLKRIEAALARLDAGNYGLCAKCDGEIELTRLDEDPTQPHCGSCAPMKAEAR